ncbi:hypothetical protein RHMOL_Rhmol06G0215500 [Rhododendron molle]|uniref:Uncharacterized protein n=1 Tax=Rhododendron molle TaxID=49168 RepID=A0ACC0NF39_RHOML|nr:hypothetical protein RHMOL_Rhmol06G0215500 [Rhododendron molle]
MRLFFRGTHLLLFDGKPQFVNMSLSCVVRFLSNEGVVGMYFGNSCGSGGGSGNATMPTSQPSSSTPSTQKSAT